ncbi:MAG: CoA transferase [Pelagibacterales bacterium]|nr:CoA transferase [Pelagibacterales bacterium]|tara:strand:+ start:943 stop:2142 length:1200 start_codon:yes stop_codon:yes gene_type:complete
MKNKGPLSGITVIDLTAMISGPVCTMMLGDQGADVIKIEPLTGELTRKVGASKNGMTTSFLCANRSKRSLTLNLKDPKGITVLKKLITKADVLVQNFRPGAMKRMGLSYGEVKKLNQEIIYTSISGFGEKGPYSNQRVYDPVIQALSGLADIQRDQKTNFPKMVRTIIPDKTTGMAAAQAISSALFYKERYGTGQHIKLAMLDVMVAYLWPEGSASLSFVGEEGDPSKGQMGLDLVFQTKDNKYITAGAVTDKEWLGMCNAFDRKDLLSDPRFNTPRARFDNKTERRLLIADEIKKHNSIDILTKLHENEVPSAPILSRTELLENEQIIENNIIEFHDSKFFGNIRSPRPAPIYSDSPINGNQLAPLLGQNSIEILKEIDYKDQEIANLLQEKVTSSID